jgi:hypothetical protein
LLVLKSMNLLKLQKVAGIWEEVYRENLQNTPKKGRKEPSNGENSRYRHGASGHYKGAC